MTEPVDGLLDESDDQAFLRRLGRRVRVLRVLAGLSQGQLGRLAGISRNFISSIERGAHGVDVVRLRRVARALGKDLTELVAEELVAEEPVGVTQDQSRAEEPHESARA